MNENDDNIEQAGRFALPVLGVYTVVCGELFLLHSARLSTLATPQSALRPPAPLRGAPRVRCSYCASAKPLPRSAATSRVVQRRRGETVARSAEGVARVKHGAGNKRKCFPTINPHFAAISPYTFTSAGSSSTSGVSQPLYNKRSTLSPPRAAPRPQRRRPQKRCAPPRRPR